MAFTAAELEYLASQPLGRLATVGADGVVQANPVGFRVEDAGTIVIGGYRMGATRKFRNVAETGRVALVVDDLKSRQPWQVRGIEIRGRAEAATDAEPPMPGTTAEVIRIHPETVFTWGVEPGEGTMTRRREP